MQIYIANKHGKKKKKDMKNKPAQKKVLPKQNWCTILLII